MRPRPEAYAEAVRMARDAIRAEKAAPRIRADRSPHAMLAKMQERQAKGEAPTEADLGALAAALAQEESRKKRGRGRPKGTRDFAALGALRAAIYAVRASGLQPYRNNTGPRLSQCDAIADAMKAEGFRTLCSYDAARREMMAHRRSMKRLYGVTADFARHMQEMQLNLSKALKPFAREMQEIGRAMNEALGPMQRQMQQAGAALAGLGARLRAQTALPPETRRAIERALKAKR